MPRCREILAPVLRLLARPDLEFLSLGVVSITINVMASRILIARSMSNRTLPAPAMSVAAITLRRSSTTHRRPSALISLALWAANGWYTSNVTLSWTIQDPQSGILSSTGCTPGYFDFRDRRHPDYLFGNQQRRSLQFRTRLTIKIDKTAPIHRLISVAPLPTRNGWNDGDVTVNWNCTDGLSGAVSASISQTLNSEGSGPISDCVCTCLDKAGNFTANSQTGINIDKTSPVLALPTDMVVEATVPTGATVIYSASVTDNLDAGISVACIPASGGLFLFGNTAINCSATDLASNSAAGSFHVIVQDTTPPVIAAHGDVLDATLHTNGADVIYTNPVTLDAVDGAGVANCSPASGSHFQVGDTLITCHATDLSRERRYASHFYGPFGF